MYRADLLETIIISVILLNRTAIAEVVIRTDIAMNRDTDDFDVCCPLVCHIFLYYDTRGRALPAEPFALRICMLISSILKRKTDRVSLVTLSSFDPLSRNGLVKVGTFVSCAVQPKPLL